MTWRVHQVRARRANAPLFFLREAENTEFSVTDGNRQPVAVIC